MNSRTWFSAALAILAAIKPTARAVVDPQLAAFRDPILFHQLGVALILARPGRHGDDLLFEGGCVCAGLSVFGQRILNDLATA
ncbi:hypothetical protein D3C84_900160 [compost metagenome]